MVAVVFAWMKLGNPDTLDKNFHDSTAVDAHKQIINKEKQDEFRSNNENFKDNEEDNLLLSNRERGNEGVDDNEYEDAVFEDIRRPT